MVRDLAFFHLPLREVVAALVHDGEIPEWNRFVHGGQPILSNPNYAAWYPPSWLALVVPVPFALSLLVIAHAAWALAGSWRLLRRLGVDRDAAALGSLGFAASSWFLALTSTFNFYCAMAWFPWVLAFGEAAFAAPRGARWGRCAVLAAAGLALQLLAGEPVAVLLTGLALAALAAGRLARLRDTAPRLVTMALLAAALGAVQLVPTVHRVAGTERGAGLAAAEANRWSTPPARLVDFVLPRFWGDPMHDEAGFWLGWGLHDGDFPYVIALYSGLLLIVLAMAGLLRWPLPYRGAWALAAASGLLFALGRHTPLWEPLRRAVPFLAVIRYPEKFAVLTAAVVPLAGALGWQHLMERRAQGERDWAMLPAAFAGITAAVAALFAVTLGVRPAVGELWIRGHSGLAPSPARLASTLAFLQREAVVSLLIATATTGLLVLVARSRPSRRTLAAAAVALLTAELAWYDRDLEPTLPVGVLASPAAAQRVRTLGGRVWSAPALDPRPEIGMRRGPRGFQQFWGRIQRLDPYVGTLWGLEYALNPDYDLMLTPWARHSLALLEEAQRRHEPVERILGAWDVGAAIVRRSPRELIAELVRTRRPPVPYLVIPTRNRLPRFRFVRTVFRVDDAAAVRSVLPTLDLANADLCIGGAATATGAYASARSLAVREGQGVSLRYQSAATAYLVAAITFDDGWGASLEDGTRISTCPTALGQLGAALPAGDHTVRLVYRDPWVRVGGAASLITLLGVALVAARRRRLGAEPPEPPIESTP